MTLNYTKIAQLRTIDALQARLDELDLELPSDDNILTADQGSPLAAPQLIGDFRVGNRWCIHPMEGWDANRDGSPSPHQHRETHGCIAQKHRSHLSAFPGPGNTRLGA